MTRTKNQKGPFIAFCTNHTKTGYGMEKNAALLLAVLRAMQTLLITGAERLTSSQETGKWKIIL